MGQEEAVPVSEPAAVAFSWERERCLLKPVTDARGGMLESPKKAATTVVLSWEHEQGMPKPAVKHRGVPASVRKAQAPTRRLSVPPPPGRPAATARGFSRAVRPEDDPFLAAYLACTKSTGGRGDDGKKKMAGARESKKGQMIRRFAWTGLGLGGLSCKRDDGAVAQSMVRLAKLPELDPRDA
uniref:Uncharacterized protein n=1 Tax=Avena sativa TaxID=4498 RepID=A0ACD5X043_AVESA